MLILLLHGLGMGASESGAVAAATGQLPLVGAGS